MTIGEKLGEVVIKIVAELKEVSEEEVKKNIGKRGFVKNFILGSLGPKFDKKLSSHGLEVNRERLFPNISLEELIRKVGVNRDTVEAIESQQE